MDLNTPYKYYSSCTENDGTSMVNIVDDNGLWVFDCFECDYIEILKRINSHDELKQQLHGYKAMAATIKALTEIVTDDHESKESFISRVKSLLSADPDVRLFSFKEEAISKFVKAYEMQKINAMQGGTVQGVGSFYATYINQLREGE